MRTMQFFFPFFSLYFGHTEDDDFLCLLHVFCLAMISTYEVHDWKLEIRNYKSGFLYLCLKSETEQLLQKLL